MRPGFLFRLACVAFFCCGIPAAASTDLRQLASDPVWKKLLHYDEPGLARRELSSAVLSRDFFLAPDGGRNPVAEIEATVAAMRAEPVSTDSHARCRFPARALWLQKNGVELPEFDEHMHCPAYVQWTRGGRVSSISIVLASGYLGNPASYYGHTLLKFNQDATHSSTLLNETLNYGAIVDKHDGPVVYIMKGVFGGYEAGFSHIDFYFHEHNYGDIELRNLWEYRLDLGKPDVDFVVAHAWEVLGKKYTYYFFRENCAYRMAEILEIIDGVSVIPARRPYTIPQSLIMAGSELVREGRPLISSVQFHPSRQSRFYQRYGQLDRRESGLLADMIAAESPFALPEFESQTVVTKARLLETTLDYYRMLGTDAQNPDPTLEKKYAAALGQRFRVAPGKVFDEAEVPAAPHLGRPPSWLQASYVHNSQWGSAAALRIRPAYYDPLDADSAHVRNSALSMADIRLLVKDERVYLYQLDLISIASVNPGISGLPGDRGLAWKLRVGGEQARQSCFDCLTPRAQADVGLGRMFSRSLFAAIYVGGLLQTPVENQSAVLGRVSAEAIVHFDGGISAGLTVEKRRSVSGGYDPRLITRLELRQSLGRNGDLRLGIEGGEASTASVGMGWYW